MLKFFISRTFFFVFVLLLIENVVKNCCGRLPNTGIQISNYRRLIYNHQNKYYGVQKDKLSYDQFLLFLFDGLVLGLEKFLYICKSY